MIVNQHDNHCHGTRFNNKRIQHGGDSEVVICCYQVLVFRMVAIQPMMINAAIMSGHLPSTMSKAPIFHVLRLPQIQLYVQHQC